jgi:hypothetical protein
VKVVERDKAIWRLQSTAIEVRAMGHLLKWQQPDAIQGEEVQVGIGEILLRLGTPLHRLSTALEKSPDEPRDGG